MRARIGAVIGILSVVFIIMSIDVLAIDYSSPVPLPQLGTDTYLGVIGGQYLNGSNNVPGGYATDAFAALQNDSDIRVLCSGMSNMKFTCEDFINKVTGETAVSSKVTIHNNGRPGRGQQAWDGSVSNLYTDLRRAGVSVDEVDVVIYFNAWMYPSGDFQSHYNEMYNSLTETMANINAVYPNLKLIYVTSREYAPPWAASLNPNPYAYQEGFSFRDIVTGRINGNLSGVPILWGAYQYDPSWPDSYFRSSDGVHLSDAGLDVAGQLWLDYFMTQPWFGNGLPLPTATPSPTSIPVTETAVSTSTPQPTGEATVTFTPFPPTFTPDGETVTSTPTGCPPWNPMCWATSTPRPTFSGWRGG